MLAQDLLSACVDIVHTIVLDGVVTSMSAHALFIYRQPIPILSMESTTSNGALSLLVGTGSGWNSVKQGMFFMVMALQVSRCGRVNIDTLHGTKKYVLICVMSISVWDKLRNSFKCLVSKVDLDRESGQKEGYG